MKIIRYNFFTLHDLKELFSSVGWKSAEDPEMLQKAFMSASHVVSAWNNETLVEIIRSMDDGIYKHFGFKLIQDCYIQKINL